MVTEAGENNRHTQKVGDGGAEAMGPNRRAGLLTASSAGRPAYVEPVSHCTICIAKKKIILLDNKIAK